ncbi:hypothetical protein [Kitasatospora purpeofusca]|uniref:hypothetical protein n=1 Tax=Kitasatospora purpeofusca TaxID=67352 RepID=UPI002A59A0B7|nr:hypothetical protein [Kitasatospora purpeofusca]MDY0810196.1 hypothetical protein [Kitasatospora purpeofusca]
MQIHRSAHARSFTVLPNGLLQDRRLSYTARGLLADLLSRPDGWREDGRHMADTSPQGRGAVRRALKELTDAGYYRVVRVRRPDGTIRSEAHVYDLPQRPGVPHPVAGERESGRAVTPPVKDLEEVPTLPEVDEQTRAAVATLFRALRPEPRLRLGLAEAQALAPLVGQWLEHGSTATDLAHALLPGLPTQLHSPVALLRDRLRRKLPPPRAGAAPATYSECPLCHDPVRRPGPCRSCSETVPRAPVTADSTATGAALARAALHRGGQLCHGAPLTGHLPSARVKTAGGGDGAGLHRPRDGSTAPKRPWGPLAPGPTAFIVL